MDRSHEGVAREAFGVTGRGEPVSRFTLTNRGGSRARLIDWGVTLTELWMPDRDGVLGDVVLGFDDLESYTTNAPYFGCIVGRVANRIAGARFELDGETFRLAANEGPHHLHGGPVGFGKTLWRAEAASDPHGPALSFRHTSPAGDEGYPGRLDVEVTVALHHDDVLHIDYRARCDAPTLVNLTHHDYWNLAGAGDVLAHELTLHADRYTEVAEDLIPTGRLRPVADTPLDFSRTKPIGRDVEAVAGGYDHNFVLAEAPRAEPAEAAVLRDPVSGREMTVSTSEPGIQLYLGQALAGIRGKRGAEYVRHAGVCLETQRFPDAVHHPHFPLTVLRPGDEYRQRTRCAFAAR